jgi:glycine C-acetyltransferase
LRRESPSSSAPRTAILYAACFDANGGLFEPLLTEQDAVISDALNHASIIDGVQVVQSQALPLCQLRYGRSGSRSCKQARADGVRDILITTDGVFSMDGFIAPLDQIVAHWRRQYQALVHIDECHASGFLGATGRGSAEVRGCDWMRSTSFTGTLGKALGGALGGFTTGKREVIEMLRQRSRPYLFSNSLPPPVVAAGLKVFELVAAGDDALRAQLQA